MERRADYASHRSLVSLTLPGLVKWDGPRRSLGSRRQDRRSLFVGTFEAGQVSELDLRLFARQLRDQEGMQGVLVGSRSLFNNRAAYLVDMGHPRAIAEVTASIDEVVLASPSRAIIMTSKSQDAWSSILTDKFKGDPFKGDPSMAIEKIRFRASQNGGRPFAKPALLGNQMRSS